MVGTMAKIGGDAMSSTSSSPQPKEAYPMSLSLTDDAPKSIIRRESSSEERPVFREHVKQHKASTTTQQALPEEYKVETNLEFLASAVETRKEWNSNMNSLGRATTTTDFPSWKQHIRDHLYHRSAEQEVIVNWYNQTAASVKKDVSEFLLVTGPVGMGKTRLVDQALHRRLQDRGGYYIRGKHDQLCRPEPYSGFVSAIHNYTDQVTHRGSDATDAVQQAISTTLGDGCSVLISLFPTLRDILGDRKSQLNNSKSEDAVQRFVFVFRLLLQAMSSTQHPIVLLLDDLQWADTCSIDMLCRIVADLKDIEGLIIIGTYDDSFHGSYLDQQLHELECSGSARITKVPLQPLSNGEVVHFVGNVLQTSDLYKVEELANIIYSRCGGNLHYVIEFLEWMQSNSMLSFQQDSWDWDVEEISMTVDQFRKGSSLNHITESLRDEIQDILKVAACFGFQLNETLIEYVVGDPVASYLAEAASMGILVCDDATGQYSFHHDGMQETIYKLIPETGRELFHLEVGRRLWRRLNKEQLEQDVFVVLSQMNIGKRLITRENERYAIASLCLHAGRKAAKLSSFRIATIYLNLGIELLGEQGWRDEYELTHATYNAAAEMNMCTASFEMMENQLETVLKYARCSADRIQAETTKIYAMGMSDRRSESLDLGISVLAGLGIHFPRIKCRRTMIREQKVVQKLLRGKSNEQLLRIPFVEDSEILACMQILNMIYLTSMLIRPDLSPFISLMLMKLTLKHGLSMLAPAAFTTYGITCISCAYDAVAAFRFGELGLQLLEQLEVREYLPRIYAGYYGCIHHWKRPLRDSLQPLLHAHRVGLLTGDMEYSSLNANLYRFVAIDSGMPLHEIERQWSGFQRTMITNRQKTMLRLTVTCSEEVQFLTDSSAGDCETDKLLQYCMENQLHHTANVIRLSKMRSAYMMNEYEIADGLSTMALQDLWSMAPTFEMISMSFITGMVAFAMALSGKRVRQNVAKAKLMILAMKCMARSCPDNCLDKKFLLKAELATLRGNTAKAYERYACAMALAKANGFLHIEALANERCARSFVRRGNKLDAEKYFSQAIALYGEWGAKAKVRILQEEVDSLCSNRAT